MFAVPYFNRVVLDSIQVLAIIGYKNQLAANMEYQTVAGVCIIDEFIIKNGKYGHMQAETAPIHLYTIQRRPKLFSTARKGRFKSNSQLPFDF